MGRELTCLSWPAGRKAGLCWRGGPGNSMSWVSYAGPAWVFTTMTVGGAGSQAVWQLVSKYPRLSPAWVPCKTAQHWGVQSIGYNNCACCIKQCSIDLCMYTSLNEQSTGATVDHTQQWKGLTRALSAPCSLHGSATQVQALQPWGVDYPPAWFPRCRDRPAAGAHSQMQRRWVRRCDQQLPHAAATGSFSSRAGLWA